MRAIYPGSFDPVTFGHLDIICRSSKIADELIIGVLKNNAKSPLFSLEERVKMLEEVTKDYHNVKVVPFEGLLVDFAKNMVEENVETIFLSSRLEFSYLSSTIVKEVASFNGDISQFVPKVVEQRIREKIQKRRV